MADILGSFGTSQPEILKLRTPAPATVPRSQTVATVEEEDSSIAPPDALEPIQVTELQYAALNGALEMGDAPEVALSALQDIGAKQEEFNKLLAKGSALTYSDVMNSRDPEVTAAKFRYEIRKQEAQKRLFDLAEQYTGGTADSITEAFDTFVNDAIQGVLPSRWVSQASGGGTYHSELAVEWTDAINTMSDEQWAGFLNSKMSHLSNPQGFASLYYGTESAWRVFDELSAVESGGYLVDDRLFGYLNVAGVIPEVPGLLRGAKGLANLGRSAIARTASSRGVQEATAVAARLMPTGTATTPALAQDIAPTAFQAPRANLRSSVAVNTVTPNTSATVNGMPQSVTNVTPIPAVANAVPTPTVNQGALIAVNRTNRFYEAIKNGFNAGSFGKTSYIDDVDQWAIARGAAVAQMHSPNIIDYAIIDHTVSHDDFLNFTGVWTMGKTAGAPFTNFNNAKQVAAGLGKTKNAAGETITHSFNAEIIDLNTNLPVTKPVRNGQYAIRFSEPWNIESGTLDLSKIKDKGHVKGFVSRWAGVAGMGGDKFLNHLAASMDAGGAKLKNFIGGEFEQAVKGLSRPEQDAVSNIIKSARDSGVPQTSWMSVADFTTQYIATTGVSPRGEVIKLYQLAQEASDATWKIKAKEQLTRLNELNTLMFKDAKGIEHKVYPYTGLRSTIAGKVLNASTGARLDPSAVPPETTIFTMVDGKSGRERYLMNVVGKTRLPTETDAYPYRPYGGRNNPESMGFVGTLTDTGWNTSLSVRSPAQGQRAVKQMTAINDGFKAMGVPFDVNAPMAGLTGPQVRQLDSIVLANNEWNPNIETWAEYTAFMKGRGVDILENVTWKERGANLTTFQDYADSFVIHKDLNGLITYSRHDEALIDFGGDHAWNPNPIHAIVRQLGQTSDQVASLQYRVEHVGRWSESLRKAMAPDAKEVLDVEAGSYNPMFAPEVIARTVKIKSNTPIGRKLRQEQNVIVRRLDVLDSSSSRSPMFDMLRSGYTNGLDRAIEALVDVSDRHKFYGVDVGRKFTPALRGLRDNTSGTLLALGFLTKMTSLSTYGVQALAVIPMAAVSPKNAFRGVTLGGYIRELMRHPQGPTLLGAMRKGIAKAAMISDVQLQDLLDHIATSGRGFARGSVVEDTHAVPGMKGLWGKAKDVLSIPFYAGENFSQMTSRITAYLDTIDKYPTMNTKSQEFWVEVTRRDQALSVNMNKSAASYMSKDSIARVIGQWKRYPLNAINTVLFDDSLTKLERIRMAASMSLLWGWAGMGLPNGWFESNDSETSWITETLKYGPIDFLLKETIGVTVGDRLGVNLPELFASVASLDAEKNIPVVKITSTFAQALYAAGSNFYAGSYELGLYDLGRIVRIAKVLDDGWMAYTMYMQDVRRTANPNGLSISKEFTSYQEFAQAMGFKPQEVNELFRLSNTGYSMKERKTKAVDAAVPFIKLAMDKADAGDYAGFTELMKDAAVAIDAYGLPTAFRLEAVNQANAYAGSDRMTRILLDCVEAGCNAKAQEFAEGLK